VVVNFNYKLSSNSSANYIFHSKFFLSILLKDKFYNSRTVQELYGFVHLYHPKIVFLSETRVTASRVSNMRWRIGLRHCLALDSVGLSGGIALFWDESVDVTLLSQGERHIDVKIKKSPDQAPWRGSFVYGEPRVENRHRMWDLLHNLCGEWDGPWLVMGDFNEAMWQLEHFSKTLRSERQMMDFREVLSHCDLHCDKWLNTSLKSIIYGYLT